MGDDSRSNSHSVVLYPELLPKAAPAPNAARGPRLVREVCREGRWFLGGNPEDESAYLTITPSLNRQLVEMWAQRELAGLRCPLQRDHSTDGIHTASPNVVLYWDECWFEDGFEHGSSVFAACYPGPKLEELIQEPCPVSPDIRWNVVDGTGKTWPVALMHVALVDHATINKQNGFVQMSLADGEVITKSPKEKKTMDFAAFVESINQLLGVIKPGLSLPETVTEETFADVFAVILQMVKADESGDEGDGADAEDTADLLVDTGSPDAVSMSLGGLRKEVAKLKAMIGVSLSLGAASAKDKFTGDVDSMIAGGFPAATRDALLEVGRVGGWKSTDLTPFKAMPGVSLGLKSTGVKLAQKSSREEARRAWRAAGLSEESIKRQEARLCGGNE